MQTRDGRVRLFRRAELGRKPTPAPSTRAEEIDHSGWEEPCQFLSLSGYIRGDFKSTQNKVAPDAPATASSHTPPEVLVLQETQER